MEEYMNHNTPCTSCIEEYYKLKRKLEENCEKDKRYSQEKKEITKKTKNKDRKIGKNGKTYSVETNYLKYTKLFEKGYSAIEVADMTKEQLSYIRNCYTLWQKQLK